MPENGLTKLGIVSVRADEITRMFSSLFFSLLPAIEPFREVRQNGGCVPYSTASQRNLSRANPLLKQKERWSQGRGSSAPGAVPDRGTSTVAVLQAVVERAVARATPPESFSPGPVTRLQALEVKLYTYSFIGSVG